MHVACKHLRAKKMFLPDSTAGESVESGSKANSACHFWCNRTLTEVGLDDQLVHPDLCQLVRACFED